jgi:hypothetical protein
MQAPESYNSSQIMDMIRSGGGHRAIWGKVRGAPACAFLSWIS